MLSVKLAKYLVTIVLKGGAGETKMEDLSQGIKRSKEGVLRETNTTAHPTDAKF